MRKYFCIFVVLILLFILIYSANFYFLSRLSSSINDSQLKAVAESKSNAESFLDELDGSKLKPIYKKKNPRYDQIRSKIIKNFQPCELESNNYSEIWHEANSVS